MGVKWIYKLNRQVTESESERQDSILSEFHTIRYKIQFTFASASHSFPVSHFYNFVFQMGLLHLHVFRALLEGVHELSMWKSQFSFRKMYSILMSLPGPSKIGIPSYRVPQGAMANLRIMSEKHFRVGLSNLRKGDLLQDSATFCKQQPNYFDFRPMYESPNIVWHLFYIPG